MEPQKECSETRSQSERRRKVPGHKCVSARQDVCAQMKMYECVCSTQGRAESSFYSISSCKCIIG